MSLPKPDLHIRLSEDAYGVLALLADVHQKPKSVVAELILEEALMGRGHVIKVAARRAVKAGLMGSHRDE